MDYCNYELFINHHTFAFPFQFGTHMSSVRVQEFGGKIEVSTTPNFTPNETIRITLLSLIEKGAGDLDGRI